MRRRGRTGWLLVVIALLTGSACSGGDEAADGTGASTPTGEDGAADGTGSGGATTGDADGSFEVTIAVGADLQSLDPHAWQDFPGRMIYGNIYESLLKRTADGQDLEPYLASAMPTQVDDLTWEFELREGVTFADGSTFDAADVVYSIERVTDPEFDSQQLSLFNTIAEVTSVDDHLVRITTEEPDPVLPARMALLLIMPEDGADAAGFPDEELVGTGPYRLAAREPDIRTVIEKRPDYWGDNQAGPDRMVQRVIAESSTRVAALEADEVDVVVQLSPDQTDLVPRVEAVTSTESMLLRLKARSGLLADEQLRDAVNIAIDRRSIVDSLFGGHAQPSKCQIAAPTVFGHNPELEVPEYQPERARQMIQDAGAAGETLELTAFAGRFAKDRETAQSVAQYLTDAGFNVDLEFPSQGTAAQQLLQEQFFPHAFQFSSNTELLDIAKQTQWLVSDGQFSGGSNERIDELAAEAASELDRDRRRELYHELAEVACDDASNIYLYYTQDLYGLSPDLDWQPRPDGLIYLTEMQSR